jgi:hypothetical protein
MPLLSLIVTDNDAASFAILLPFGASDAFQFHGLRHGHRGPLYHQHVAFGGKRYSGGPCGSTSSVTA